MSFEIVTEFERRVASFFGAPYAVAVDSCTHGIELCLRMQHLSYINVPTRTYISVPFLAKKLNIQLNWHDIYWRDFYKLNTDFKPIYDAAVLWIRNSYIAGSFMCISFQFQKHLSLGRGGIILCDDMDDYMQLKKASYDGRLPNVPWRDQDIDTVGYHYYMTPETAQDGLDGLENAINTTPRRWEISDWPDVSKMSVFASPVVVDPYLQTI